MTMSQKQSQALTENWDQAKTKIRSAFPGLSDSDLSSGQHDPNSLAASISAKTGQDVKDVERELGNVAQQFTR